MHLDRYERLVIT